jgi:hypothetical protein
MKRFAPLLLILTSLLSPGALAESAGTDNRHLNAGLP